MDRNGTTFRRGSLVRFIRWVSSRDAGWTAEIIEGRYLERADCGWLVEIEGTPTVVTKDDWAVFR